MKRPSFQFYPGDWMRSTDLRCCSVGARGLWIDMICLMHEGKPYGHLKVGDKVILPANLASITGATLANVEEWLSELMETGVCSTDEHGCIFSRRMIRDEELRQIRAAGGSKGGNPALLGNKSGDARLTSEDKQNTTPSSASSSSSSSASSKSKNKTSMPDNFTASPAVLKWAAEQGYSSGYVDSNLAAFVLSAQAKGYRYVDWDKALMNAIRANWAKASNDKPDRHGGFDSVDYRKGVSDDGSF